MKRMIDCHCHFYPPQFNAQDLAELEAAAEAVGVTAIITVPERWDLFAVWVHMVAEVQPVLDFIRQHSDRLVAVGEIGLDFSPHIIGKDETLREVQQAVFQEQIQLASELGLPVNVHSRSAGHYAIDTLIQLGSRSALLHAFDGKLSHALKGAAAGFFFSVPPSIVRSPQKQKLVKGLPLDRLVLETDAPALGPDKSSINVPANIVISCREVARIKGLSEQEVMEFTTENALKLFPAL
eukprot:gene4995-5236_t